MPANELGGILNVLKPPGMTSFDVVGYLRKVLKIKRIGHTGTLDPAATGVLTVCVGQATKAIEYMVDKDKLYRAELTLGIATDTQDHTGEVLASRAVDVTDEDIRKALKTFIGRYRQVPPMYSAVKIGGKKLYELAREGVTVEREPREVEIFFLEIINIKREISGTVKVLFDVHCSKGTYIRTLCADAGERLGCGGHMSFLVRLKAGEFDIASAVTVEELGELAESGSLETRMLPVDSAFRAMKRLQLDAGASRKLANGARVGLKNREFQPGETLTVYDENNSFFALGETFMSNQELMLKSKKLFV